MIKLFEPDVGIDVSPNGWNSEVIEYPFVFEHMIRNICYTTETIMAKVDLDIQF